MKKLLLTAALTLSSLSFAGAYDIDTAHAAANFSVKHLGVSSVNGNLGDVTGTVDLDEKDVTKSKVNATIDVKGINTKQGKRDDHLRSPDFFDVEKFPTITFKSTKVEKGEGNKLKVTGDLTMHGVTKAVVLDGELAPEVANPFSGAKTRGFSATTMLNRKDYGLNWNKALETGGVLVGEDVKVAIEAELTPKAPAAAPAKAAPAPAKK
ncbi:MAG TPA: YceI family protein [Archangium sp.]